MEIIIENMSIFYGILKKRSIEIHDIIHDNATDLAYSLLIF